MKEGEENEEAVFHPRIKVINSITCAGLSSGPGSDINQIRYMTFLEHLVSSGLGISCKDNDIIITITITTITVTTSICKEVFRIDALQSPSFSERLVTYSLFTGEERTICPGNWEALALGFPL